MKTVTITFEVDEAVTGAQLHEALCKAVHEGDFQDLESLGEDIVDVVLTSLPT